MLLPDAFCTLRRASGSAALLALVNEPSQYGPALGGYVRAPALLALVGDAISAGVEPIAAIRMAAGLAAGARVQAAAFADMVVGELWSEDDPAVAELVSTGRRARLQLTQAVASLVVHEVGMELRARAALPGGRGLDDLVDGLRVGVVRGRGGSSE